MDYELLLQFALRATGCRAADVRFGVLPPQSCLRRNDEGEINQTFLYLSLFPRSAATWM
jgi:hypothetical protein